LSRGPRKLPFGVGPKAVAKIRFHPQPKEREHPQNEEGMRKKEKRDNPGRERAKGGGKGEEVERRLVVLSGGGSEKIAKR